MKELLKITSDKAKYDTYVKKILAHKSILAYILKDTVDIFRDKDISDISSCIEDNISIGNIPLDPSFTNTKIIGINTEDNEINEGLIRYDIVFYVHLKNNLSKIIINIEAQKDEPSKYKILNRAIFYVCRLVSSQKQKDFINSNYDDIKQVYSIWLCMNTKNNSLSHYHLIKEDKLIPYNWKGNIDLINIVLLGISNDINNNNKHDMHGLLTVLFTSKLKAQQKLSIIKQEYNIPTDDNTFRKDVSDMCNLGEGLVERTVERVTKEAEKEKRKAVREATKKANMKNNAKVVINMYKKGYTYDEIADVIELSVNDIKVIIENKRLCQVNCVSFFN